jgi:hypothetical protein
MEIPIKGCTLFLGIIFLIAIIIVFLMCCIKGPGVMAHAYILSTQEAEERESQIQGQLGLHSEFQVAWTI